MGSGLWTAGRPGWGGAEQGWGAGLGGGPGGPGRGPGERRRRARSVPPPSTGSRWRAPGWPCPRWRSLAGAGRGQVQVRPALTFSSGKTSCSLVVWPKPHALPPRPEGAPLRPVAALSVRTWEHSLLLHQPWGPWAGPEQGGLRPHPPVPAQGGCGVPLSTTRRPQREAPPGGFWSRVSGACVSQGPAAAHTGSSPAPLLCHTPSTYVVGAQLFPMSQSGPLGQERVVRGCELDLHRPHAAHEPDPLCEPHPG